MILRMEEKDDLSKREKSLFIGAWERIRSNENLKQIESPQKKAIKQIRRFSIIRKFIRRRIFRRIMGKY